MLENGNSAAEFDASLEFYSKDKEILKKKQSLEREFIMALSGRVNEEVTGEVPDISRERLLQIQ